MSISENAYKALIDANFDYRNEIDKLRAENERLRGWIASLDNEAEGLHQRLAAFADNNEALRARIALLEATIDRIFKSDVWDIDAAIGETQAILDTKAQP